MLSILEYALSLGKVFILEFLTQVSDILTHHVSLLEKINFLYYRCYQGEILVFSFLFGLE